MNKDETAFLLNKYLVPQHREDPNVIRFIVSYLDNRSVAQAASEAGITRRSGENLKRRPDIHAAIVAITDKAVLKHGYDASEVIQRLKEVMNVDPGDLQNPDGSYKESLADVPPELRRAIKRFKAKNTYEYDANGIKTVSGKMIEVEFWDKMKAVEFLGGEKQLFKKTQIVEHTIGAGMRNILLESKQRAEEAARDVIEITIKDDTKDGV
jgi:hypothetical protein